MSEHINRVNPESLSAPRGFSHAVVGSGTTVFLAGQTGMTRDGTIVDGLLPQFELALTNLLTALREAGGTPSDLTSMTIYIVDMEDYLAHTREIGSIWKHLVGSDFPAMAGVGVTRLWDIEALVEIQGFAVLGAGPSVIPVGAP